MVRLGPTECIDTLDDMTNHSEQRVVSELAHFSRIFPFLHGLLTTLHSFSASSCLKLRPHKIIQERKDKEGQI